MLPHTYCILHVCLTTEPARGLQKVAAQMGRYSVGAAALVPAVKREPSLSDIQSKGVCVCVCACMRA